MSDQASEIRKYIRFQLESLASAKGKRIETLSDELELFETGILDSLGFIKLVSDIEREFGLEVDFSQHDPEAFSTLGGLVNVVCANPDMA